MEGRDPVTGEQLLAGSRQRSVRAFDMTFSAPKSVSLLWAFATEPVAEVVAAAHREAVAEALAFLEERAAVARVQAGGVRRRVATDGWAVAAFTHRTSREGDPQLHSHCLVPNLVKRKTDGRYVALDAGPLFDWCRAAGSVYQDHLQRSLSLRLGVVWGPDRHNTREIIGFSREQLRAFSKRSAQIEAELEAKGALYESPALRMRADDEASLATRTAKDHSLTPTLLQGRWREEAAAVGLADGHGSGGGGVLEGAAAWTRPTWDEVAATLVDPDVGLVLPVGPLHPSRRGRAHLRCFRWPAQCGGGRHDGRAVPRLRAGGALDPRRGGGPAPAGAVVDRRPPGTWKTARSPSWARWLAATSLLSKTPSLEAALAAAPALGEDQAAAVKVLAGEGGGLRAVLAPAGYGKTTMLHAAAQAAAADGHPVVAVATTAKAVAELAGAGLDARTIARLRLDLANGPLAAGTVVVLDEVSQTPTHEVEAVLAAVDACPGGSVWVLGDPRQSQPVGAGGVADHIERLAHEGLVPSARLTVNRRQLDPADQEALGLLRRGDAAASQQLRTEHGWEHELATPGETRRTMADAVCTDIGRYGAEQVAALVVSHTDAEDLADRVRARLAATGALAGPALVGPGWTAEREYQAGDRVLLHARCGPSGSPLVNGSHRHGHRRRRAGLTVRLDGSGEAMSLPAAFVQGTRKDGSPNLSHAWARTVDGAQGGTWEACHLLGSAALDAYRGYTGQSRSRQPTHTWNTARVAVVDHGGALADQRDAAEQVAGALARQPDPSLAARSDPWVLDRQLRERIAEHERVLAARPPDRREASRRRDQGPPGSRELPGRQGGLRLPHGRPAGGDGRARRVDPTGQRAAPLVAGQVGLRRRTCCCCQGQLQRACPPYFPVSAESKTLFDRFEAAEGWRRDDISRLRGQLDHHWAEVVAACVQADDPLAYGVDKLRHARATTAGDLRDLDARVPVDRATERDDARRQLADALRARQQAEEALGTARAAFDESGRRRWGRKDQQEVATAKAGVVFAEQRLERVAAAEGELQERFASLARHQQERQRATAAADAGRKQLKATLAQFDAALDHTRADRVRALADDPPAHLVERLGPVPSSPAGRAVWCHHALGIEAVLDQRGLGRDAHEAEPGHGTSPAGGRHRRPAVALQRRPG